LGKVGISRRQRAGKIGEGLALALVQVASYFGEPECPCSSRIPRRRKDTDLVSIRRSVFDPIEQNPQMTPRQ